MTSAGTVAKVSRIEGSTTYRQAGLSDTREPSDLTGGAIFAFSTENQESFPFLNLR